MSVIAFPNNVRVSDVATAIGILSGMEVHRVPLDNGYWYVKVAGVSVTSCADIPECCFINAGDIRIMYHFEFTVPTANPEIETGARGILPPSTPRWFAIGRALVNLFGGSITYSDDPGNRTPSLTVPENPLNGAQDGEAWQTHQERIMALRPITEDA